MTETDDYTDDPTDALDAFVSEPAVAARGGIGFGTALTLSLLAAIGGAVGGWALGQYVMPKFIAPAAAKAEPVNLEPLTARLTAAEKKLTGQSAQLSRLTAEIISSKASITVGGVDETLDITPLLNRIDDLETRLNAAGADVGSGVREDAVPTPTDTPRLSFETSDDVTKDLQSFETRLAQLEANLAQASTSSSPLESVDYSAEIDALRQRIAGLEAEMSRELAAAKALAATPVIIKDPVLLPPFPREAMLAAMVEQADNPEQSWLGKTLKKHISVRNPQEVERATARLDAVEALIENGDYAGALSAVEAMPSQVRSPASAWIAAVKREVQTAGATP